MYFYAIIRQRGYRHNLASVSFVYPAIRFAQQFIFVKKYIMGKKIIKVFIAARKWDTIISYFPGVRHHKSIFNKYELSHIQ